MRIEARAIIGFLSLAIASCQSGISTGQAQTGRSTIGLAPLPASCAADEVPVLSCRLLRSGNIASLCGRRAGDSWNFRFAYGSASAPLLASFPVDGVDRGEEFKKSRLMLFGGAGGLVYSAVAQDRRYALYSIQGKGFSIAGLQISLPGAEKAISDERCKQATVVESEDEALYEALQSWNSDPSYEDKDLLPVIEPR